MGGGAGGQAQMARRLAGRADSVGSAGARRRSSWQQLAADSWLQHRHHPDPALRLTSDSWPAVVLVSLPSGAQACTSARGAWLVYTKRCR